MPSGKLAMKVQDLGKVYRIAHQEKHTTLGEALIHKAKHPFRRVQRESFWAVRGINFEVYPGDTLGIIGRNGAGKSTLLKLLSRITEPTEGQIDVYGRVGSLLEVGTGFHPELTGRENVYLNGAILGMRKPEIDREFDSIVDFAGVERFLDTPVKRYSSGMYVRLAFAVAAHLRTEILVVDEVLAVGDAEFQKRCLGKMQDVASGGRTVLFVSHNMHAIRLLCNRGIFLRQGSVQVDGTASNAIDAYLASFAKDAETAALTPEKRPGSGQYRITEVFWEKEVYNGDEPKVLHFTVKKYGDPVGSMNMVADIFNGAGLGICHCDSRLVGFGFDDTEELHGKFTINTPWLKPDDYRVDLYISAAGVVDKFELATTLHISPVLPYPSSAPEDAIGAEVFADFNWEVDAKVNSEIALQESARSY